MHNITFKFRPLFIAFLYCFPKARKNGRQVGVEKERGKMKAGRREGSLWQVLRAQRLLTHREPVMGLCY